MESCTLSVCEIGSSLEQILISKVCNLLLDFMNNDGDLVSVRPKLPVQEKVVDEDGEAESEAVEELCEEELLVVKTEAVSELDKGSGDLVSASVRCVLSPVRRDVKTVVKSVVPSLSSPIFLT